MKLMIIKKKIYMNTFHISQLEELIMLSYQYQQKRKTDLVEKNLRFYFAEIKKTQPKVFVEFTPICQALGDSVQCSNVLQIYKNENNVV